MRKKKSWNRYKKKDGYLKKTDNHLNKISNKITYSITITKYFEFDQKSSVFVISIFSTLPSPINL